MGSNSKIEWTTHTFNPWIGCTKVAPGCTHCYAESFAKRTGKAKWGPNGTRTLTGVSYWKQPLKWNREAADIAERPRVFCASLADVFEDWEGPLSGDARCWADLDDVRKALFGLIDATPNLDWILLTKRPENIIRMWDYSRKLNNGRVSQNEGDNIDVFRPNVWLLTSVSEQETAERNIPLIMKCRQLAPVLGISAEPLCGPIDLNLDCLRCSECGYSRQDAQTNGDHYLCKGVVPSLDWVICGGESGHHARPMNPQWAESLRDQCVASGVAFHFKQWGEYEPAGAMGSHCFNSGASVHELVTMNRVGKKAAGRLLDGREWSEFPQPSPAAG